MKKKGSFIKNFKNEWMLHVMLLPATILLAVFAYYPMVGIVIAFQDFVPSGGMGQFFHSEWVGCMRSGHRILPIPPTAEKGMRSS